MKIETFVKIGRKLKFFLKLAHFIFSCDISPKAEIGKNVKFCHNGLGVVIGGTAKIGNNCTIYPFTLFGNKEGKYPIIEDNVTIYPHSIIIGNITIGKNSIIGAGSFINRNIPQNSVVYNERKLAIRHIK